MKVRSRVAALALVLLAGCPGGGDDPAPPAPVLAAVAPDLGPASGGTAVVLTGTGFRSGATVTFGGVAATGVTVVSATELHATTPAHGSGAVDVAVQNDDGLADVLAGGFFYNPPVLVVAPNSGAAAGGGLASVVAMGGYEFGQPVEIWFGATQGTVRASPAPTSTSFLAIVPAGAPGAVTVTVKNADGSTYPATATYTYQ
jgi:hypothetical protein